MQVRVLSAPVALWEEATSHTQDLMREFALMTIGAHAGTTRPVQQRLLDLVAQLRVTYAGATTEQELALDAAVVAGRSTIDLTYLLPIGVGAACRALSDLLDEADAHCASGGMMTLVTPPEQVAFRRWYLGEFVRQEAGLPALAWPDAGSP